jgi:hypothetical protein
MSANEMRAALHHREAARHDLSPARDSDLHSLVTVANGGAPAIDPAACRRPV